MNLKPCPFCGEQCDEITMMPAHKDSIFEAHECPACGARGPYVRADREEKAGEAWNHRVEDKDLRTDNGNLLGEVHYLRMLVAELESKDPEAK